MQFRGCPRNREGFLSLSRELCSIHLGFEPFCVWAEEEKMKVLILIGLFVLLSVTVDAQALGSVAGKILDGGKIAGSHRIDLIAPNAEVRSTNADNDGRFKFDGLTNGKYKLSARIGAQTVEKEIDVFAGQTVEVVLEFDSTQTLGQGVIKESVTISANALQPIDEVSKTVNVIDGQEMRDRADITLADSLRTIPGFRVQQLGGFGRTASIKTRGLRNQDTAILIDGVRFRDAAAISGDASSFLSDITLTSVSKVEVLRGSGSSLYGTNAIGGVVNFVTPTARDGWHGQISGAFGGLGFGRFRGVTSYGTEKFGFNLGVSRTAYTKGIDGEDNASNTNLQPRVDFRPSDNTLISARFFFSDAKVRLNASPDTLGTMPVSNTTIIDAEEGVNFVADVNDPDSIQKSRAFNGVVSVTHNFTPSVWVNGYYSALQTKRRNGNGLLGPPFQSGSTTHNDGLIQTANANVNFSPRFHNIKAGYEFEHEKYSNENFTPSGTNDNWTRAFQSSHTLFAQDVLSLHGGRLQIGGGIRGQWFDLKLPEFSLNNTLFANSTSIEPEAALTVDLAASYFFRSSNTKLRVHIGNGYRVPSLYERFGSYYSTWPTTSFVALGDPGLKPEKSIAYDAGIEQGIFDGKATLTATYFYTHLRDVIAYGSVPQPDPNNRLGGYLNTKGGISRGGEFSIDAKPTRSTDVFASYTYTNSDQLEPQIAGSGVIRALGIPTNQVTFVITQRFKRFWVNFDLLAASDYLAPMFSSSFPYGSYVYRFDGNRRGDLTGGYTFRLGKDAYNLRVFGTIENIFDQEYYENGFKTAGINGRVGVNFSF